MAKGRCGFQLQVRLAPVVEHAPLTSWIGPGWRHRLYYRESDTKECERPIRVWAVVNPQRVFPEQNHGLSASLLPLAPAPVART